MKKRITKYLGNESGVLTIEFISILPMLLLVFLLIWQLTLTAYSFILTEAAARDGARVAVEYAYQYKDDPSIHYKIKQAVYDRVKQTAQGLKIVTEPDVDLSIGDRITVTVEATVMTVKLPILERLSFTISSTSTMPVY